MLNVNVVGDNVLILVRKIKNQSCKVKLATFFIAQFELLDLKKFPSYNKAHSLKVKNLEVFYERKFKNY